jgi:hypothetical protein
MRKDTFKVSRLDVPSASALSSVGYINYGKSATGSSTLTVDIVAAQTQALVLSPTSNPSTERTRRKEFSPPSDYPSRKKSLSPTNELDWKHLVGGHYNSPRCINTDHKSRKSPHFLRKTRDSTTKSHTVFMMDENAPEAPVLLERRAAQLFHSPKSPKHKPIKSPKTPKSPKSPPKGADIETQQEQATEPRPQTEPARAETHSNPDYVDHYATFESESSKLQVPTSTVNISLTPRLNKQEGGFVPLPRIRHKTKVNKNHYINSPAEQKETIDSAFRNFDRQHMEYMAEEFETDKLPEDLVPTVEAMKRKKNMMRNNYQKFYPRGIKGLTPYRHYTSYKLAINEWEQKKNEQQRVVDVVHHKMYNDLMVENKRRQSFQH